MNIFRIFLESSLVAQIIMSILLLLSIYSWGIFFKKLYDLRRIEKDWRFWNDVINSWNIERYFKNENLLLGSFFGEIIYKGLSEFKKTGDIENAKVKLTNEKIKKIEELESQVYLLGTTVTLSPFLGLLGTVWGIMVSFLQIRIRGSAHITVVAPGISDALITTVYGLLVAIPALFFYNLILRRIEIVESRIEMLEGVFITSIKAGEIEKKEKF
uniref:MotA/TolQ/ExbB proton channel domain-containing protein n=1 Tax=candidate division WOR-3 bacterium TaxID=2052148 RepID=A0A7C4UEZ4_UNCW3